MSEEAVKARAQALPDDLKNSLALDDEAQDGEAQEDSVYDQLGKWIDDAAKEKGDINKVPDVEIYLKAKDLGIESKHRTPAVLAQTIFSTGIVKEIEPRASSISSQRRLIISCIWAEQSAANRAWNGSGACRRRISRSTWPRVRPSASLSPILGIPAVSGRRTPSGSGSAGQVLAVTAAA